MTPDATAHQRTERLDQFRNFTMAHPRLVEARDELVDAIEGATPGSLVMVLGPPSRSPPEKQLLALGAAPTRFRVPETNGQNRRNVCTSTESLLSVSSAATPKQRPPTQPTSRSSRSPPRRPRGTMPGLGNLAPSCIDAWPSGNWPPISRAPSPKARMWPSRELRSQEYQRELAVGTQKPALTQRVWEIRVDSVLKLDRAAKRETTDENHEEVPR